MSLEGLQGMRFDRDNSYALNATGVGTSRGAMLGVHNNSMAESRTTPSIM